LPRPNISNSIIALIFSLSYFINDRGKHNLIIAISKEDLSKPLKRAILEKVHG